MLFITESTIGQETELIQKISVYYNKVPLKEVIEDISKKGDIKFSYSSKTISINTPVSYSATDKPLSDILNDVFKTAGVQYENIGGYLVLSKAQEPIIEPTPKKQEKFSISGTITDATTREVLIGAAIYNKETGTGALSNKYGYFSLTLPKGSYTLESSYLGYTIESKAVELNKNLVWNINLQTSNAVMEEIVISSFNREEIIFTSLAAQNNISAFEVEKKVAVLGETDMLRSLGGIPGISFQNEGSSYIHVRGGNRDQNLILLDEATIYNPSHMLGLFTSIIPEAVKHTEIYKGDFPVQYGGRLSSVIDIRTKDGNMQKFSGSGSIGLVSTRLNFEGPFKKNSSSYFVSFRRSHLGMFVKAAEPNLDEFFFSDFTSKFNVKIGEKDRLYLTLYSGVDKFLASPNNNKEGIEWENTSLTLRWNHIFGSRLFSNTTFYTSKYNYIFHIPNTASSSWNSHISSTNLKSEFTYYSTPNVSFKYGVNLGVYFINPGEYVGAGATDQLKVSQVNSSEFILYAGVEQKLTSCLLVNYGLRLTNWSNIGEAFSIIFDDNNEPVDYKNYSKGEQYYSSLKAEPRISLSVKTGIYTSLKASYNRTIQHINLINNSISPFNSLEVWLPSGPNIKPQYANIYNLGYIVSLEKSKLNVQADVFYKQLFNQVGYKYHAEMLLNPAIEGELRQGKGKAYGFEVLVKRTIGRLSGNLGYSFVRSKLKIEDLNNSKEFFSRQDKPLDFSLAIYYQLKPRWSVNCNYLYGSGMKYTTPTGFYMYRGSQIPIYTEQNNDRLPSYKRFDIGTNIRLNNLDKRVEHFLSISLYNLFASTNPYALNFSKSQQSDGSFIIPADKLNSQKQVSTFRYLYSVVPSINYNLRF